jgi:hypothetical protein
VPHVTASHECLTFETVEGRRVQIKLETLMGDADQKPDDAVRPDGVGLMLWVIAFQLMEQTQRQAQSNQLQVEQAKTQERIADGMESLVALVTAQQAAASQVDQTAMMAEAMKAFQGMMPGGMGGGTEARVTREPGNGGD